MYDNLGSLMRDALLAYRNCDPQILLQHLEAGDAGAWLLQKCKGAQMCLYTMPFPEDHKDGYRANCWSDAKYEMLFPNYTKRADNETYKKLDILLGKQGDIVDKALRAANLGYDWNPEHQTEYSAE